MRVTSSAVKTFYERLKKTRRKEEKTKTNLVSTFLLFFPVALLKDILAIYTLSFSSCIVLCVMYSVLMLINYSVR